MPTGFLGNPTRPSCLLTGLGGLSCSALSQESQTTLFFFSIKEKNHSSTLVPARSVRIAVPFSPLLLLMTI